MDLEKAYDDDVSREKLWKVLEDQVWGEREVVKVNSGTACGWKGEGESWGNGVGAVWCTQRCETRLYPIPVDFQCVYGLCDKRGKKTVLERGEAVKWPGYSCLLMTWW